MVLHTTGAFKIIYTTVTKNRELRFSATYIPKQKSFYSFINPTPSILVYCTEKTHLASSFNLGSV